MDKGTVRVYEARAGDWVNRRQPSETDAAVRFGARVTPGAWRADIGCGPGWHLPSLGSPALALDAAAAMLALVPDHAPGPPRVRADVEALPLRRGALAGAWAHKTYQHVPAVRLPLALADLHRSIAVDGRLHLRVTSDRWLGDGNDPFPGRFFEHWNQDRLGRVVAGAGFAIDEIAYDGKAWIDVEARRMRTLADTVGSGMRVLLVGLNPSVYSADVGVGFARPGNRFWPAALASSLVTRDRDPRHALIAHGVGMTDLVKRATARADELSRDEYRAGASRVEALVEWLEPGCVCFVGLSGYRGAVDRAAKTGWQERPFAGRPAYVMPNPSGINAHATPALLAQHLREMLSRHP